MTVELWRDTEFPGYEISNLGNVRSGRLGRNLKPWLMTNGYFAVTITSEKRMTIYIHRLIALAFIPLVAGKDHVNHKNGIKTDNRIDNLEWCTHAENIRHAFSNGLVKNKMGGVKAMLAVTSKPVEQIIPATGEVVATYPSLNQAMRSTKLGSIRKCVVGAQKEAGGYVWRYKEPPEKAHAA